MTPKIVKRRSGLHKPRKSPSPAMVGIFRSESSRKVRGGR